MGGNALLPLVAFGVNGFTCAYVFARNRRSPVNRAYLLLASWLTAWMLVSTLLWSDVSGGLEARLRDLYPLTWVPVGFLLLNFSYVFAGRKRDRLYSTFFLVAAGLVAFGLVYDVFDPNTGMSWMSGVFLLSATVGGVTLPVVNSWVLVYNQGRVQVDPNLRQQMTLILVGIMLTLAIGFYSDVVIASTLSYYDYRPLGACCAAALCICVAVAVGRYRFLSLGVDDVAFELFAGVREGVVIIDAMGRIVQYNPAAAGFVEAASSNSLFGDVPELFPGYSPWNEYSDYETAIRSTSGARYVAVSQYPISNGGRDCGRILLIRDITSFKQAQDELKRHQDHLERLVEERTAEITGVNISLEKEIRERRQREAELRRQELLLRAASEATNRLLTVPDMTSAIKQAVSLLGEAVGADWICMLEERVDKDGACRYQQILEWSSSSGGARSLDSGPAPLSALQRCIGAHRNQLHLGNVLDVEVSGCTDSAEIPQPAGGVRACRPTDGVAVHEPTDDSGRSGRRGCPCTIAIVPEQLSEGAWVYLCFAHNACWGRWSEGDRWVLITVAAAVAGAVRRSRVEAAYREGQDRLRGIVEHALDLIGELGEDGRYVYVSPSYLTTMGYTPSDLLGRECFEFIHPDDREKAKEQFSLALHSRTTMRMEVRFRHVTGAWLWTEVSGKLYKSVTGETRMVIVSRDVTRRKQLEDEALRSNKLESIGVLAGGIAHDFNNILSVLWSNFSLTKLAASEYPTIMSRLQEVEKALMRARDLTKQLLTFARGGEPVKKTVSLTDIIKESARFTLQGADIKFTLVEDEDLWLVDVDEGQLNQVFSNIFINARQAMPCGGQVTVLVENSHIGPNLDATLRAGSYVVASIEDTGPGIDESVIGRIFDPYFTTKENGTGLGLATAYSVVKKHGGHISVTSTKGHGTTFWIYVPASPNRRRSESTFASPQLHGKGRILVMDDEEDLRRATVQLLQESGYEAEGACDGQEAVDMYAEAERRGRPFDVVIMDLIVPSGMGGKEAVRQLRSIHPDVKVIASSGYSDDPVMSDYRRHGFSSVLAKPYTAEELAESLHACLHPQALDTINESAATAHAGLQTRG